MKIRGFLRVRNKLLVVILFIYRVFLNDMRIFKGVNLHEKLMIVYFINYGPKMYRYENTGC